MKQRSFRHLHNASTAAEGQEHMCSVFSPAAGKAALCAHVLCLRMFHSLCRFTAVNPILSKNLCSGREGYLHFPPAQA